MHLDLGPISHSVAELLRVQGGRKLPLIRGGDAGQKNRQETDTLVAASPAELFPEPASPRPHSPDFCFISIAGPRLTTLHRI